MGSNVMKTDSLQFRKSIFACIVDWSDDQEDQPIFDFLNDVKCNRRYFSKMRGFRKINPSILEYYVCSRDGGDDVDLSSLIVYYYKSQYFKISFFYTRRQADLNDFYLYLNSIWKTYLCYGFISVDEVISRPIQYAVGAEFQDRPHGIESSNGTTDSVDTRIAYVNNWTESLYRSKEHLNGRLRDLYRVNKVDSLQRQNILNSSLSESREAEWTELRDGYWELYLSGK